MPLARAVTRWKGPAFEKRFRAGLARNLKDAIEAVQAGIVADISTDGAGSPPAHSRPGDPPFRQSGELVKSFSTMVDPAALIAQVGSDAPYSLMLEQGTPRMLPRPYIARNVYFNPQALVLLVRPV